MNDNYYLNKIRLFTSFVIGAGLCFYVCMAAVKARDAQLYRNYPSVFMAWNEDFHQQSSSLAGMSHHDLIFLGSQAMGLGRTDHGEKLSPEELLVALKKRQAIALANPNALVLVEIRYYDAWDGYLPADSALWRRNEKGERIASGGDISGATRVYLLDFSRPEFQDNVANQCHIYVESGVFDGCMLDWWNEAYSDVPGAEGTARLALIRKIRAAVGDKALLFGNVNGTLPRMTASYLNGAYLEGFGSKRFSDWRQAAGNLAWLESHLKPPALPALEAWYDCGSCSGNTAEVQAQGRGNLSLMREVTTLALVNSDGYVLFSDPDVLSTADHLHNWYPFWNKTLGHPAGPKHMRATDGTFRRAFDNGCAVFNPPDNRSVIIDFLRPHRSEATGIVSTSHTINHGDGDILLKMDTDISSSNNHVDTCLSAKAQKSSTTTNPNIWERAQQLSLHPAEREERAFNTVKAEDSHASEVRTLPKIKG